MSFYLSTLNQSLGFQENKESVLEIAIATFDEDLPVRVDVNIYTAYKANWCYISNEVDEYVEGR